MSGLSTHRWLDERRAPLYVARLPPCDDDDVLELMLACDNVYERATGPIAWVLDGSETSSMSARARRHCADHLARNRQAIARYVAGIAIVTPSSLLRGAVKAVSWLSPFNFDHELFAHRQDAVHWALTKLAAAQLRETPNRQE